MDKTHPLHYIKTFSSSHNQTSTLQFDNDQDNEISIFDAHKYFGQNNNDSYNPHEPPTTLPRLSSVSSVDGKNLRTRSFHATPTASSEASWNSQTGLLVNPPGSVKVSLSSRDRENIKISSLSGRSNNNNNKKKWNFGQKCCCTGKKSVRVKEATTSASVHNLRPTPPPPRPPTTKSHNNINNNNNINNSKKKSTKSDREKKKALSNSTIVPRSSSTTIDDVDLSPSDKSDPPRQQRISASGRSFIDSGFSFPILKNPAQPGFKSTSSKAIVEDPPRDSLEVYQPIMENVIINPARRHHFNPGSPIGRVETTDDDLGSDASSDLFELDSFSTQTSLYPMYRRRDSLDEAPTFNARRFNNYGRQSLDEPPTPSVAATECYAPSEVSIDWSVTTAEGYERPSVSNFSVSASEASGAAFLRQRMKEEAGGDNGKRNGGGGLLMMSCRNGKAVSVGRQTAEGGGETREGGRPPRASKTTALGNDHSARLSAAFAA
ncbi:hypothetical protein CASFOL_025642 [Castilleja foliolosa]|uniref:Uncharacterized protein n=1 Tax=Castilleja foliolosa TaxID=1961234 RepID=A0ABD3CSK3_9LAMI